MDSWFFLSVPRCVDSAIAGPERRTTLAGKCPPPDSDPFNGAESGENYPSQSRQFAAAQTADSSSINAVSFSSARTTKRFRSSRCASATNIVSPRESTVATQPQLQPALLRLSAMISKYCRVLVPIGHIHSICACHPNQWRKRLTLARLIRPRGSRVCQINLVRYVRHIAFFVSQ